jgi:hypothetical protein
MTIAQSQRNTPAPRMYVGYPGLFGMFEVGDHANLAFAFCRPHVTSRFVLNRQNHPQTAHPRIIITNQTALHVVMHLPFRLNALRISPLSIQIVTIPSQGFWAQWVGLLGGFAGFMQGRWDDCWKQYTSFVIVAT